MFTEQHVERKLKIDMCKFAIFRVVVLLFLRLLFHKLVCTLGVLLQQHSGSAPLHPSRLGILILIVICWQQRRAETFWTPHPPRAARPRLCPCLFSCRDVMGLDGWKQYSQEKPGDPDTLSSQMCSQEWWRRQEVGPPMFEFCSRWHWHLPWGSAAWAAAQRLAPFVRKTASTETQSGSKTFKSLTRWCVRAVWTACVELARWYHRVWAWENKCVHWTLPISRFWGYIFQRAKSMFFLKDVFWWQPEGKLLYWKYVCVPLETKKNY